MAGLESRRYRHRSGQLGNGRLRRERQLFYTTSNGRPGNVGTPAPYTTAQGTATAPDDCPVVIPPIGMKAAEHELLQHIPRRAAFAALRGPQTSGPAHALAAGAILRPFHKPSVLVRIPDFSPEDTRAWERRLTPLIQECGCNHGAVAVGLFLLLTVRLPSSRILRMISANLRKPISSGLDASSAGSSRVPSPASSWAGPCRLSAPPRLPGVGDTINAVAHRHLLMGAQSVRQTRRVAAPPHDERGGDHDQGD